jgi:hypothetical protein
MSNSELPVFIYRIVKRSIGTAVLSASNLKKNDSILILQEIKFHGIPG